MAGFSLHIGVNKVSADHYGSEMPLAGCVNDAVAMEKIARNQGFATTSLHDSAATVGAVAGSLNTMSRRARRGDIVFISYAGHGGSIPDTDGDELDFRDETWCLFDRQMVDDELFGLYSLFASDVRVLIFSDSCHSGTVARKALALDIDNPFEPDGEKVRTLTPQQAAEVYGRNQEQYDTAQALASVGARAELSCSLQLFAACQDDQVALDGAGNGLFTSHVLRQWDDGHWQGSYTDLYDALRTNLPAAHSPNRMILGRENATFLAQRPFTV